MDFKSIDSNIKTKEEELKVLRRELADTDSWWEKNRKITAHFFNGNDEWLALRNSLNDRVGGSEIGTVAGHNRYMSPYALFCQKVGLVQAKDISDKEAVIQGHEFEQKVAERFEQVTGKRVHEETAIFTNSDAPHLKASIDRKIFDEDSGLECKTVKDIVMRKFPQGDFPQQYYDQCASYLKVTGLKRWYLAMLVFGTDFKVFLMSTDKGEIDRYNQLHDLLVSEALSDEDADEWNRKYAYLEAAYYISPEELEGCEVLAAEFMTRVSSYLGGDSNAWPIDEMDGSQSSLSAVKEAYAIAKPDSVVTFDESMGENGRDDTGAVYNEYKMSDLVALCDRRAEMVKCRDDLDEQIAAFDVQMASIMKDKEEFLLPRWKVTFKEGAQREFASVKAVKDYFAAIGKEVPSGMITLSEKKRGIRFWSNKGKAKKGKK